MDIGTTQVTALIAAVTALLVAITALLNAWRLARATQQRTGNTEAQEGEKAPAVAKEPTLPSEVV